MKSEAMYYIHICYPATPLPSSTEAASPGHPSGQPSVCKLVPEPQYPKIPDSLFTASNTWRAAREREKTAQRKVSVLSGPQTGQTLLMYSFFPPHKLAEPQTPVARTIDSILGLRICAHCLSIVQSTPTPAHVFFPPNYYNFLTCILPSKPPVPPGHCLTTAPSSPKSSSPSCSSVPVQLEHYLFFESFFPKL